MATPRSPKGRAKETLARLDLEYPDAQCELDHRNPYELLAATILSAQCTDVRVNQVTPALFARFPTPEDLAVADPLEVEELVRSTGFYKNKARSLVGMAQALVERYGAEVPSSMEELVTVPGVGRKTANVVRSVAMDLPADWGRFSLLLILHGRRVCASRKARCVDCVLGDYCPSVSL